MRAASHPRALRARLLAPALAFAGVLSIARLGPGCRAPEPAGLAPPTARAEVLGSAPTARTEVLGSAPTGAAPLASAAPSASSPGGAPGPSSTADASASTSAAPSGVPSAEPAGEPLPPCVRRPARAPVGVGLAGTPSGFVFTTADRATEPSLQRAQLLLDGAARSAYQAWCHVSRSDGELLVAFCTSIYLNGSGNPRTGPSGSFVFYRYGNDWTRIDVPVALPGAGADPRVALAPACRGTPLSHLAEIPLDNPGLGSAWLGGVEPWPLELHLEAGDRYSPGGSGTCSVPWSALGKELGCGPFAHLLRPELLDPAALATAAPGPLAFARVTVSDTWGLLRHYPQFASADPRHAAVVARVNDAVRAYYDAAVARGDRSEIVCDTTLSDARFASVLCESRNDMEAPATGPTVGSVTYRLADGAPITAADIFGRAPGALARAVRKCLSPLLVQPTTPFEEYIPQLPTPSPQEVGFGLGQNELQVVVPYQSYRHTAPESGGIAHARCTLGYGELGLSLAELARVPGR
ncbi:MAG: hypothetical protein IT373_29425 [Polyangiaceae bacterium]|nr:hypothetical protein [Polyangiaceae bacterium]